MPNDWESLFCPLNFIYVSLSGDFLVNWLRWVLKCFHIYCEIWANIELNFFMIVSLPLRFFQLKYLSSSPASCPHFLISHVFIKCCLLIARARLLRVVVSCLHNTEVINKQDEKLFVCTSNNLIEQLNCARSIGA